MMITTTRNSNVAESCCSSFSGSIYSIRPLNMVCSRKLFHRRLFDSKEDCPSHLEEISYEILRKCAGLPLAIIAISGLLANRERTKDIWIEVEKSIGHALERNPAIEGMIKIVSLSYFDLPPHIKTCLLYLSIFSEDSVIQKEALIWKWVAEGFVRKINRYTAYDLGERCFNELVNRSLIQVVDTNIFHEVESFRVHDTILDFIISKAIEENFVTLLGVPNVRVRLQNKVRRLSLQLGGQGSSIIPACMGLSHVRSLNVFMESLEIPSLDEFRHLRTLDFQGCTKLENHHLSNIGRLFQLRCLILRKTKLTKIPEGIGHLCCLEVLDIEDTEVRELPAAIVNLGKLVYLLMPHSVKIPDGIAKMQALEVLDWVSVQDQTFNLLQELGQLRNLRKLVLGFLEDTVKSEDVRMEAIASSVQNLSSQNLRSLIIKGDGRSFMQSRLLSLQSPKAGSSLVPQVSDWVVSLRRLCLHLEEVKQDDICILGALPALVDLDLTSGPGGITLCYGFERLSRDFYGSPKGGKLIINGDVGFPCLRHFSFNAYKYLLHVRFEVGSMPKLDKLTMAFCFAPFYYPDITTQGGVFDFGIKNLPNLSTLMCITAVRLDSFSSNEQLAKAAVERTVKAHPNNPTLSFHVTYL